jgi:hypothetical protein
MSVLLVPVGKFHKQTADEEVAGAGTLNPHFGKKWKNLAEDSPNI